MLPQRPLAGDYSREPVSAHMFGEKPVKAAQLSTSKGEIKNRITFVKGDTKNLYAVAYKAIAGKPPDSTEIYRSDDRKFVSLLIKDADKVDAKEMWILVNRASLKERFHVSDEEIKTHEDLGTLSGFLNERAQKIENNLSTIRKTFVRAKAEAIKDSKGKETDRYNIVGTDLDPDNRYAVAYKPITGGKMKGDQYILTERFTKSYWVPAKVMNEYGEEAWILLNRESLKKRFNVTDLDIDNAVKANDVGGLLERVKNEAIKRITQYPKELTLSAKFIAQIIPDLQNACNKELNTHEKTKSKDSLSRFLGQLDGIKTELDRIKRELDVIKKYAEGNKDEEKINQYCENLRRIIIDIRGKVDGINNVKSDEDKASALKYIIEHDLGHLTAPLANIKRLVIDKPEKMLQNSKEMISHTNSIEPFITTFVKNCTVASKSVIDEKCFKTLDEIKLRADGNKNEAQIKLHCEHLRKIMTHLNEKVKKVPDAPVSNNKKDIEKWNAEWEGIVQDLDRLHLSFNNIAKLVGAKEMEVKTPDDYINELEVYLESKQKEDIGIEIDKEKKGKKIEEDWTY